MKREQWFRQLEGYLDGELDPPQRAAFAAATAADPRLQEELAARRAFGAAARAALTADLPPDLEDLAVRAMRSGRRSASLRLPRRRVALALAAALVVVMLAPGLWRHFPGMGGSRAGGCCSGRVIAVRFGERPGRSVTLQAGCYDQDQGFCH